MSEALRTETGQFYTADIASIGDAATDTTDSNVIDVSDWAFMSVHLFCTGKQATAVSDIVADFVVSPDGTNYDTLPYCQVRLTMNGTTKAQQGALIDIRGVRFIKITQIENTDTTADDDAETVNCLYLLKG